MPKVHPANSEKKFTAKLVLTPDGVAFRREWNQNPNPKLLTSNAVEIGDSIFAEILFQNCTVNADNKCDVSAEYFLVDAKGKRTEIGNAQLWSSNPLEGAFMLGAADAELNFAEKDRIGSYRLLAIVYDRYSSQKIELTTPLNVIFPVSH